MKKKMSFCITFIISLILLSSCIYDMGSNISGDGNIVSEVRGIGTFTGIDAGGGLEVFITFGEEYGVEVVADENLLEIIHTEIKGNTLRIRPEISIRKATSKKIYVTVPSLTRINISSAATLQGQNNLETEELKVSVSSAGSLRLEVYARKISIDLSSSGSATIEGETEKLQVNVSSAAGLIAKALEAEEVKIDASSAGSASVFVTGMLDAKASSAGSISYYGNPEERNIKTSSAGSINNKGRL